MTRDEAIQAGFPSFDSDKPCKHGHIGQRRVANWECCECSKSRSTKWRTDNPDKMHALRADYEQRNPDRLKAYKAAWIQANKGRFKEIMAAWRAANQEHIKADRRNYCDRNRAAIRARAREQSGTPIVLERDRQYRARNKHALKAKRRIYVKKNQAMFSAYSASRRALERKAMPLWADRVAIEAVYASALTLSAETGIKHHVDHAIPLRGKNRSNKWIVCGLHIAENLQVLPWQENMRKGCLFED